MFTLKELAVIERIFGYVVWNFKPTAEEIELYEKVNRMIEEGDYKEERSN